MEIIALLSQRVASVSSVPAGDRAGGFADVLQSAAARSVSGQAAPLEQQTASMAPAPTEAGLSGFLPPLQFTLAALAPESAPLTEPGTISQAAAAIGAEPVQQGLAAMDGRQPAIQPGSPAEIATEPAPLTSAAVVATATAAPAPTATAAPTAPTVTPAPTAPTALATTATTAATALSGNRLQAPVVQAAGSTLTEAPSAPAAPATATRTRNLEPTRETTAALAVTPPATNAGTLPDTSLLSPKVDWSRNSPAELQRGPGELVGTAAPTSSALAGTGGSAPQPAMSALLQASLSAPVASPAWPQQLGNQLTGLAQRGRQQIELHLNPADLGPLSVSLKVDDHGAQAQFLSAHATVRAAVEQAIPQLREALAEQGIALGETSVGEQQHKGNEQSGTGQGPVSTTAAVDSVEAAELNLNAAATALPGGLSGVDIYA